MQNLVALYQGSPTFSNGGSQTLTHDGQGPRFLKDEEKKTHKVTIMIYCRDI